MSYEQLPGAAFSAVMICIAVIYAWFAGYAKGRKDSQLGRPWIDE